MVTFVFGPRQMPKPGRLYVPLDVGFFDGDGAELSPPAQNLFLRMVARCKLLASDGRLTLAQVAICGGPVAESIVELLAGPLVQSVAGGILIPSWRAWNDTNGASKIDASVGNHTRWHINRNIIDPDCSLCRSSLETPKDDPPMIRSDSPEQSRAERSEQIREGSEASPPVDPLRGFDKFWEAYPARNSKKLGKAKAVVHWKRLTLEQRREAYRGALHYAEACEADLTLAKDAERWLRDKCWTDWQAPAVASPRTNGHTAPNAVVIRETADPRAFVSAAQAAPVPAELKARLAHVL